MLKKALLRHAKKQENKRQSKQEDTSFKVQSIKLY